MKWQQLSEARRSSPSDKMRVNTLQDRVCLLIKSINTVKWIIPAEVMYFEINE